jgi:cell division protein FtsI (penicillin-binding protein 3)
LLARRKASDANLEESSPDHLGAPLDVAEAGERSSAPATTKPSAIAAQVVPASLAQKTPSAMASTAPSAPSSEPDDSPTQKLPASGTVVLDVEEGGIAVPSFLGKSVRAAVEAAQDAGLDLDAIGSGIAREQSPLPGSHVAAGSRVTVRFGR